MVSVILSFSGHSIDSSDLPTKSLEHLLQLGFSTAIKNSIAGVKAGVLGNGANPWTDDDISKAAERFAITGAGRDERTALAICAALQREMFEAIISGETRKTRASSPRKSDDEKLREAIAIEQLDLLYKNNGKALPKRTKKDEKEAFFTLVAQALASTKVSAKDGLTFAERVEQEFKARKANQEALDGESIEDLI